MAIGLYKPGQGYWVRVLTATLIGVVTLAAGAWMFSQMGLVAEKLPRSVWSMGLSQAPATAPAPGLSVVFVGKSVAGDNAPEVGQAVVESYNAAAKELRIRDVVMKDGTKDPAAAAVKLGTGAPMPIANGTIVGKPAIEPFLLQGMVAAVVILIGAVIAYYFTAMHQKFCDFLIATDGEMKKVNWSTYNDIKWSTIVVIFAAFILSASLFIVDFGFQWFFKTIGVLVN